MVLSLAAVLGDTIPTHLEWAEEDDVTAAAQLDGSDSDGIEAVKPGSFSRKRPYAHASSSTLSSRLASGSTPKGAGGRLSDTQIELMTIISILLRAPNAPILCQTELVPSESPEQSGFLVPRILLSKFVRYFQDYPVETSGYADAIWGMNALLTQLELNARILLIPFTIAIMPILLNRWREAKSSRDKNMRNGLLVAIRIVFPFLVAGEGVSPSDLEVASRRIIEGVPPRPLPLESLRLTLCEVAKNRDAFKGATFQYGFNFESDHVSTWCGLEAYSDCVHQVRSPCASFKPEYAKGLTT